MEISFRNFCLGHGVHDLQANPFPGSATLGRPGGSELLRHVFRASAGDFHHMLRQTLGEKIRDQVDRSRLGKCHCESLKLGGKAMQSLFQQVTWQYFIDLPVLAKPFLSSSDYAIIVFFLQQVDIHKQIMQQIQSLARKA